MLSGNTLGDTIYNPQIVYHVLGSRRTTEKLSVVLLDHK
jgi:hypothetical protein